MTAKGTAVRQRNRPWLGVIAEYADRLPVTDATPVVTLGEGGTPLVSAGHLSSLTGTHQRATNQADHSGRAATRASARMRRTSSAPSS